MNMNDKELLDNFITTRNLKPRTRKGYQYSLKQYTDFHQMTLQELLQEAEDEEEQGIRWKHRRLKTRLITFRNWLQSNYLNNTAKKNFGRVATFYRHYEIEIHSLPPYNERNSNYPEAITYDKLPDKEIIKHALKVTKSPVMRAIILFMSSSGCAMAETLNLTIQSFIEATKPYHNTDDIYTALNMMKEREDIVPIFRLRRKKNKKFYYTFCTPEATHEIILYLLSRNKTLTHTDKLFKIHEIHLFNKFSEINDTLNLGTIGKHRRFRSHMLRKFHASNLKNAGMSKDDINHIQGKSRNHTDESYFYDDPKILQEIYISYMGAVTINLDVNSLDIRSPEYVRIEEENKDLRSNLDAIYERLEKLENNKPSWDEFIKKE